MKIIFICLGNICRSPLAEGILKHKLRQKKLNWTVDSAATSSFHSNSAPDKRSIDIALSKGIDISEQRSRKINSNDYIFFDKIFVMDSSNYNDVMKNALESEKHKISLVLNEIKDLDFNIKNVPDPYYDNINGFNYVFELLDKACDSIIENYCKN